MTPEQYITSQIERISELSGAYVACGMHLESADDAELDERVDEVSELMRTALEFDQTSKDDVSALVGAKMLTSFYGTMRAILGGDAVDPLWRMFLEMNAQHRADLLAEGS